MVSELSRRKILQAGGTAGLASLCSLAGCSDSTGEGSTPSAAETPPIDYREWLPRPEWFGAQHYYFNADDYTQLRADDERFAQSVYDDYIERAIFDTLGLGIDDVSYAIRVSLLSRSPTPSLIHGEFGQSAVVDSLRSLDYTVADQRETYSIYEAPDEDRFVGVEDGVVALSESSAQEVALQLSTPDADEGGYTAASDALTSVLDAVGYGTFIFGGTTDPPEDSSVDAGDGYFPGQIAYAYADRVDGATTESTFAYRFEDEDAAAGAEADVVAYFASDTYSEYANVTVSQDGQTIVVEGETDTDELYT